MATEYDLLRCMLIREEKRDQSIGRRLVEWFSRRTLSLGSLLVRIFPEWKPKGRQRDRAR